ncbi:unnamed protein product [marine sediment metagenome]|uniref:Uncharacterized protein n=1 Tax=marine sediment metagenome TaxID=412755 RepID=X1EUN3_9ZZZZ
MKNGFYKEEEIKNENIPPEYIYISGHTVRKNGKEITSYYETKKAHFKVGNKKGDKPMKISLDDYLYD